ncbi:transposase [Halobacteroides halobius]|uniref:transposase n=1 Tax=Halobacteroides halobius TaxID=42422 RepID=UPI000694AB1E|nr:transposase [Halobacteroides halobius]
MLTDSWYTSKDLIEYSLSKGFHYIGGLRSNYTLKPAGIPIKISDFYQYIEKDELDFVKLDDDYYYVYRYQGKVGKIDYATVLLCWKNDFSNSDSPKCILSTDTKLSTQTILEYYAKRWNIETSFYYFKNTLGLNDYRIKSLQGVIRFWHIVYLAYNYLEILRVLTPNDINLGDTLIIARDYILKDLIRFIYYAIKEEIPITKIYDTLNLDGNDLYLVA